MKFTSWLAIMIRFQATIMAIVCSQAHITGKCQDGVSQLEPGAPEADSVKGVEPHIYGAVLRDRVENRGKGPGTNKPWHQEMTRFVAGFELKSSLTDSPRGLRGSAIPSFLVLATFQKLYP
ncbi:hypothetical protein BDP55DRAFT_752605 [Colletotrichum godetiae]|uniref:Uncharacterized protein n=1 Tax=Colletotrichum godetiae TaxID=1209918 RepID=A0AAJ0AE93_9PEZI|nr:uncharacterized protein BDP55DRAFT_752605 [Colletotrichum godetiae]KAK1671639.1 hypothetical protein BDP55DRAFT_752605 [Colletotrichum godetiae]